MEYSKYSRMMRLPPNSNLFSEPDNVTRLT